VLELVLVLVLLFALVTTVTQHNPPISSYRENLRVLGRYTEDLKNMVCNSDRDRMLVLNNESLNVINASLSYASPEDLTYRLVVLNSSNSQTISSTGFPLPTDKSIMTSSCLLVKGNTRYKVQVMAWR
jgi:hypothetical protein